jgi:hypothetical protein
MMWKSKECMGLKYRIDLQAWKKRVAMMMWKIGGYGKVLERM